jgi:hypothetical protein
MELVRIIREKQPDAYIVLPVNFLFYLHYYKIMMKWSAYSCWNVHWKDQL